MDNKKFTLWNRIVAAAVSLIAAVVYLMTIEPTASFWDCGEFIASSYKLEVGHPPGNPVFQLFARLFTMFSDNMHAAVAVNAFSAICSALTIFFLYLTIVFLAKRLIKPSEEGIYSLPKAIAVFGSGAVGALAYTFSDTFWFSAVEGEVYAMSSLITALVFWAMTKWYEQADRPYANRWIVLISFLMGLSIGIHLLNLLAIPALVFMYYYKQREGGHYTFGASAPCRSISPTRTSNPSTGGDTASPTATRWRAPPTEIPGSCSWTAGGKMTIPPMTTSPWTRSPRSVTSS